MLMNKVSPATLCLSQDGGKTSELTTDRLSGSDLSSQFSQTSYDLFPSQPHYSTLHGRNVRHGFSQHGSQLKQTGVPTDYYQRYQLAPRMNTSFSQRSSSSTQSSSNSNDLSFLNRSHYEQWKNESAEKTENKAVIDTIVKVTKDCAQELGESLNNLKQSLTNATEPHSSGLLLTDETFKKEHSQLFDYHKTGYSELLQSQLELRQTLTEMNEKRGLQLSSLEAKIDSFVKSTDERFNSLQSLLETTMNAFKQQTQSNYQQIPTPQELPSIPTPLVESTNTRHNLIIKKQSNDEQEKKLLDKRNISDGCPSSSPATVPCSGNSQSEVGIDLSQLSPYKTISQCSTGSREDRTGIAKTLVNHTDTKQPLGQKRRSYRSVVTPRTPVVTRNRSKRQRNNSNENCHITTTTRRSTCIKSRDTARRNVKRRTKSATHDLDPQMTCSQSFVNYPRDDDVFLCSPAAVSSSIRNQQIIQSRQEEQKKRMENNKSILKGSQDILKELNLFNYQTNTQMIRIIK